MTLDGRLDARRRPVSALLWAALVFAVGSAVVWAVWVLPIAASVSDAAPVQTGDSVAVPAGSDAVGVWASGRSAMLGTLSCSVDGEAVDAWTGPSLSWDDTLWWVRGRLGFAQELQLRLDPSSPHEVTCVDALGIYEAEYLVARDAFGTSDVGLGRTGSADFALGSVLAVTAVLGPLMTVMFPVAAAINAVGRRRRVRRPFEG